MVMCYVDGVIDESDGSEHEKQNSVEWFIYDTYISVRYKCVSYRHKSIVYGRVQMYLYK